VQLYRNLRGLVAADGDDGPTHQLEAMVRVDLAMQAALKLACPATAE
jgi:hypothetical protein